MITYWQLLLALAATAALIDYVWWKLIFSDFFTVAFLKAIHQSQPELYHSVCDGSLTSNAEKDSQQGKENRCEPEKEGSESGEPSKEAL